MIFLESLCKISTVVPGIKAVKFLEKKKKMKENAEMQRGKQRVRRDRPRARDTGHTLHHRPVAYTVQLGSR